MQLPFYYIDDTEFLTLNWSELLHECDLNGTCLSCQSYRYADYNVCDAMHDVDPVNNHSRLSKGEDVVVCLPGARIQHVIERVEKIMGRGNGGSILVHVGTNNVDKEGTTAIVDKYRKLLKKTKQARIGHIILSGMLPVFGNRIQGYRNSKRMAVNGMVKRLCKEEEVGYVDLWDSFVGKDEMYPRDGLHLSGKGAAVFAEGLSGAVASGLGKVSYLN